MRTLFDYIDILSLQILRVTNEELDTILKEATDEELELFVKDILTFKEKREYLQLIYKLYEYIKKD
jgi:hypothetical protein